MEGFKEWYTSEVCITPDEAKARGVYDVDVMAKCWQAATERAAGIADKVEGRGRAVGELIAAAIRKG